MKHVFKSEILFYVFKNKKNCFLKTVPKIESSSFIMHFFILDRRMINFLLRVRLEMISLA